MVPPPGGHHPKFKWQRATGCDRLRDQSRTLHEEIVRIEWQGEQVYRTPTHNALASQVIVKRLHAMLGTATMTDPALHPGGGTRG
jgi:hypothetical protein